jgi:hypothetical protein
MTKVKLRKPKSKSAIYLTKDRPQRRPCRTPKPALDNLQVDLADATLDFYTEVDIRFAVGVVDVGVAHPS